MLFSCGRVEFHVLVFDEVLRANQMLAAFGPGERGSILVTAKNASWIGANGLIYANERLSRPWRTHSGPLRLAGRVCRGPVAVDPPKRLVSCGTPISLPLASGPHGPCSSSLTLDYWATALGDLTLKA